MNETLSRSFPLGKVVITPYARDHLHPEDVSLSIMRHARCDWGDCCKVDAAENELSLKEGLQLFSVYHNRNNVRFWIITEADRSATTVLLPEDF